MEIKPKEKFGKTFAIGNEKFEVSPTVAKAENANEESTLQKDLVSKTTSPDGVLTREDVERSKT